MSTVLVNVFSVSSHMFTGQTDTIISTALSKKTCKLNRSKQKICFEMKLFCKELKGNEIALDGVEEDTRVADIKKQIENKLNIPGKD